MKQTYNTHTHTQILRYVLREATETCLCDFYHEERKKKEEKKQKVGSKRRSNGTHELSSKRRKKKKNSSISNKSGENSTEIALKAVAQFVRIIMSSSYDVEFMRAAIRVLNVSEVLLLLRMVLRWLEKDSRGDAVATRTIEILVDAHFMSLRLAASQSEDTTKLLSQLDKIVKVRVGMCESIAPLGGHVQQLKRGSHGPTVASDYSIEMITL